MHKAASLRLGSCCPGLAPSAAAHRAALVVGIPRTSSTALGPAAQRPVGLTGAWDM